MKNALVRTTLVVLALCVGAWLALGYRAVKLEETGQAAVTQIQHGPISPAKRREALDALDDARFLNADEGPNLVEGNLRLFTGHRAQAVALARHITTDEPDNASGWFLAYLAEQGAAKQEALERLEALDPWAGEALRRTD
ncbi:MAG TPA: hypothetical protein VH741_07765 [Candidatus Limnocylindrales bacterium]|jgi:hypothetical protein